VKSTSSIYIGGLFTARGDPGKKIELVKFSYQWLFSSKRSSFFTFRCLFSIGVSATHWFNHAYLSSYRRKALCNLPWDNPRFLRWRSKGSGDGYESR